VGVLFVMGRISINRESLRKMLNLRRHLARIESVYEVKVDFGKEWHKIKGNRHVACFLFLLFKFLNDYSLSAIQ